MKHARKTALAALPSRVRHCCPSVGLSKAASRCQSSAQARVGRPLSPERAGVARRQTRRAVYGAGVVGAAPPSRHGCAIGTAGAVAATSLTGDGGAPYQTGWVTTQVVLRWECSGRQGGLLALPSAAWGA